MATDERSSGRECGGRIYRACSQNPGLIPPRAASPAAEKGSLPPAAEFLCHRAKLPLSRRAERPLRAWRAGNRLGKAPGGHGAGALPRGPDVLVAWHLQRPDSSAASRAPPPPASRLPPSRIRTRGGEDSVSFRFLETHEPTFNVCPLGIRVWLFAPSRRRSGTARPGREVGGARPRPAHLPLRSGLGPAASHVHPLPSSTPFPHTAVTKTNEGAVAGTVGALLTAAACVRAPQTGAREDGSGMQPAEER